MRLKFLRILFRPLPPQADGGGAQSYEVVHVGGTGTDTAAVTGVDVEINVGGVLD
jgi:hypothetical protein